MPAAYRGILWMVLTTLMLNGVNALAKILAETHPIPQVLWARFFFNGVLLALIFRRSIPGLLVSRQPAAQIGRSALMVTVTVFLFISFHLLPLADVTAVIFLSPVLVTALAVPLLGERVDARRWLGVLVGFSGALVIIRPGAGMMELAVIAPLCAALTHACFQIATRKISGRDRAVTTLVYTPLVGFIGCCAIVPWYWVNPDPWGWAQMVAIGLIGGGAHFALIKSFEAAQASTVAPFYYVSLIWATALGYVLFNNLPDLWTVVGAMIITASGLYIFRREQLAAAAAAR